jgi:triphosphatase
VTDGAGPHPAAPVETEWQFDAIDVRPVERWLAAVPEDGPRVEPGPTTAIVDTYLDTEDWRIYRAGYSLRIRRKGGSLQATLKSLDEGENGLRRRAEYTETLAPDGAAALLMAPGPVGERSRLAAGPRPLVPLFDVRTQRHEYRLTVDGVPAGEIAVDRTTIPLGERAESTRLRRVEVEVPEGMVATLAPFVTSMRLGAGLHPATLSKFQAGLLARGYEPVVAPELGPVAIDPSQTVGEVSFAILRRHLAAALAHEPGTRIGDDAEELHDMRVATRRLRAALAIFAEILPVRFARLRDELGWVGDALGRVRDLDVQLAQLDAWASDSSKEDAAALAPLREVLHEQRRDARERMIVVLNSSRYDRLIGAFAEGLRRGPLRTSKAAGRPVEVVAPELILDRYRAVRKAGRRIAPDSHLPAYHRVRIRAKRLRYALEFLTDVYPKEIPPLVRRLVAVQDLLGLVQDAAVATQRLRTMVAEQGSTLPPATIFAMGVVSRRYGEQEEKLRRRFPKAYAHLSAKPWKALRREMLRRAAAASPGATASQTAPALAPVEEAASASGPSAGLATPGDAG